MKKTITVRCDQQVMGACEYYQLSVRNRMSESKSRITALLVSAVCWLIAGSQDQTGQSWFITMLTVVAASFVSCVFYPKDTYVKKVVYYITVFYTLACLIFSVLGVVGVLVAHNGSISLTEGGAYHGNPIMSANTYFFGLGGILALDLIGWIACSAYDHRIKSASSVALKGDLQG